MSQITATTSLAELALDSDVAKLQSAFLNHMRYSLAKDRHTATKRDCYAALVHAVRDRLIDRWIHTQQRYYDEDVKRVYYLSLEFLTGRLLGSNLLNSGMYDLAKQALKEFNLDLDELLEFEWDTGLGNGGLGRLAACFIESMASLGLPAYGYCIRYEYGIFYQKIDRGYQVETPDNWLRYGNPWEFARAEYLFPVRFYGRVNQYVDQAGRLRHEWADADLVMAMAYDVPVPGYDNSTVNTLRLWGAKSSREFDLDYFNHGDYIQAVEDKNRTENISRVLYPRDDTWQGKELRFKQEYFLVSATLQDILRRHKKHHKTWTTLSDKVAIQLNDTHPALAVPELMRILLDQEGLEWEDAWTIAVKTFGYTNHTVLPEALERWPVDLMSRVLPRHMQIIYEINRRLLDEIARRYPDDLERMKRMSIIEEGNVKQVRMANLAIVGSHAVNGVSALHSQILKDGLFRDFHEFYPGKFSNKTNGITPRRWLKQCNPSLGELITRNIGGGWPRNLSELDKLVPLADNARFRDDWAKSKLTNKKRLAGVIRQELGIDINVESMFDCQVKRIHEYKRQLLNVLHVIALYNRIKDNPRGQHVPRTVMFAGKAAPAYFQAKLIIKLIHAVGEVVNRDPDVGDRLKVVFLPNYRVSQAEIVMPAADLSEQISTAGMEASGTGNMKFALNGALTIGTLDGANVEIKECVGDDNIFIFGLTASEVEATRKTGYNPYDYYQRNPELRRALDMIRDGAFSAREPVNLFQPIYDALVNRGDYYFLLADFDAYVACQEKVSACFKDQQTWIRKSIYNSARMGFFSSDRTIQEYAREIWGVEA